MSFEFSGKIFSASFTDPLNTVIEVLFKRDDEIHNYHLPVDFSSPDFLAFIEEWPLEKLERDARETARKTAVAAEEAKEKYDKEIIDTYRAQLKEDYDKRFGDEISNIKKDYDKQIEDITISCKNIFNYINENNKDRTSVFDLKLSVLEHSMDLKDKKLKLRIRKARTILDLLQIYNETVK